nr:MAG TPA: hypothetical protein [Caudoviricetes sp.]
MGGERVVEKFSKKTKNANKDKNYVKGQLICLTLMFIDICLIIITLVIKLMLELGGIT